ncbi:MAG: sigma-70 family RNA polymerase sigma factor [Armatimonadia bacterium]
MLFAFLLSVVRAVVGGRGEDLRLAHEGSLQELSDYLEALRPTLTSGIRRAYSSLEEAAEDIVQTAFAGLLISNAASFRRYQGKASLQTYVTGIVRRRAIDFMRKAPDLSAPLTDHENLVAAPHEQEPLALVGQAELCEEVQAAVAQLPERYGLVIKLYYFAEQDCTEIGLALGCSAKRVTSLLVEARQRLRKQLSGHLPDFA